MPCYPFTAGELDESKTLIELCMHLDDGDDSDVELAEDLLLMAAEPLQRGSKQEIGPEKLSLERLRREAAERGTDGDDPSPTLYTVLREAKKIPTLRTRMIVATVGLVCSDQLS